MNTLIPDDLLETLPNLYETQRALNPICQIKLFTPDSIFTWYIIEISKEDKHTCYGYVKGFEGELGYFSLQELKSIKGPLGLKIERDISFNPTALAIIRKSE
jgi:Holliday junction resolvasome RuvABC DNA-binding subunit